MKHNNIYLLWQTNHLNFVQNYKHFFDERIEFKLSLSSKLSTRLSHVQQALDNSNNINNSSSNNNDTFDV